MKTVTAVIRKGEKYYIGECIEIDVITQGKTIDETIKNLKEAVILYFEGEKLDNFELSGEPAITFPINVKEYAV